MGEVGTTTAEVRRIIERRRGVAVATLCAAVEESSMLRTEQDAVKTVIRATVNAFADGISAMLPSVVDEDIPVNTLYLEFIERIAGDVVDDLSEAIKSRLAGEPAERAAG